MRSKPYGDIWKNIEAGYDITLCFTNVYVMQWFCVIQIIYPVVAVKARKPQQFL
jgi:hypothetical protein